VNARINLFTAEGNIGIAPDPQEILTIAEDAYAVGAHEEAARAVVNFLWTAGGFMPADAVEATARAGLDGRVIPPSIGVYVELSFVKGYIPAGRWAEADALLAAIDEARISMTARLVYRPSRGSLALRRGDLDGAAKWLTGLRELAIASGEPQRIHPMAGAVFPWLHLTGKREELRAATRELLSWGSDQWMAGLSIVPVVRTLGVAGETELLRELLESLQNSSVSEIAYHGNAMVIARGLIDLADGRAEEAVESLRDAAAFQRGCGFDFDAACLELDLARALAGDGQDDEAASVRGAAEACLASLNCVNAL
jgi:hypothetical protein